MQRTLMSDIKKNHIYDGDRRYGQKDYVKAYKHYKKFYDKYHDKLGANNEHLLHCQLSMLFCRLGAQAIPLDNAEFINDLCVLAENLPAGHRDSSRVINIVSDALDDTLRAHSLYYFAKYIYENIDSNKKRIQDEFLRLDSNSEEGKIILLKKALDALKSAASIYAEVFKDDTYHADSAKELMRDFHHLLADDYPRALQEMQKNPKQTHAKRKREMPEKPVLEKGESLPKKPHRFNPHHIFHSRNNRHKEEDQARPQNKHGM